MSLLAQSRAIVHAYVPSPLAQAVDKLLFNGPLQTLPGGSKQSMEPREIIIFPKAAATSPSQRRALGIKRFRGDRDEDDESNLGAARRSYKEHDNFVFGDVSGSKGAFPTPAANPWSSKTVEQVERQGEADVQVVLDMAREALLAKSVAMDALFQELCEARAASKVKSDLLQEVRGKFAQLNEEQLQASRSEDPPQRAKPDSGDAYKSANLETLTQSIHVSSAENTSQPNGSSRLANGSSAGTTPAGVVNPNSEAVSGPATDAETVSTVASREGCKATLAKQLAELDRVKASLMELEEVKAKLALTQDELECALAEVDHQRHLRIIAEDGVSALGCTLEKARRELAEERAARRADNGMILAQSSSEWQALEALQEEQSRCRRIEAAAELLQAWLQDCMAHCKGLHQKQSLLQQQVNALLEERGQWCEASGRFSQLVEYAPVAVTQQPDGTSPDLSGMFRGLVEAAQECGIPLRMDPSSAASDCRTPLPFSSPTSADLSSPTSLFRPSLQFTPSQEDSRCSLSTGSWGLGYGGQVEGFGGNNAGEVAAPATPTNSPLDWSNSEQRLSANWRALLNHVTQFSQEGANLSPQAFKNLNSPNGPSYMGVESQELVFDYPGAEGQSKSSPALGLGTPLLFAGVGSSNDSHKERLAADANGSLGSGTNLTNVSEHAFTTSGFCSRTVASCQTHSSESVLPVKSPTMVSFISSQSYHDSQTIELPVGASKSQPTVSPPESSILATLSKDSVGRLQTTSLVVDSPPRPLGVQLQRRQQCPVLGTFIQDKCSDENPSATFPQIKETVFNIPTPSFGLVGWRANAVPLQDVSNTDVHSHKQESTTVLFDLASKPSATRMAVVASSGGSASVARKCATQKLTVTSRTFSHRFSGRVDIGDSVSNKERSVVRRMEF